MFIHNKTERFGTAKRTFFTTTGWRAFPKVLRFQQPQLLLVQPIFDQEDFWHPDVRLRVLTWLLPCCFTPPFPRPISIAFLWTINRSTNNHFFRSVLLFFEVFKQSAVKSLSVPFPKKKKTAICVYSLSDESRDPKCQWSEVSKLEGMAFPVKIHFERERKRVSEREKKSATIYC